ncbi:MAG: hypothetical protein PVSMB7_23030 [Chloroflexota bacterium]
MFRDEARWRRHKGACPYYRENWVQGEERTAGGDVVLYEIYCLKGWPPVSQEEQNNCMCASSRCWRNNESHRITPEQSRAMREQESA